ncbi:uncharacterized protein [Cherax quadricarinatus]|uniref:uncharacterized protein n=1 Tax=Cherax quadricarinatus TaxID=27406 RepID=UPI00387EB814
MNLIHVWLLVMVAAAGSTSAQVSELRVRLHLLRHLLYLSRQQGEATGGPHNISKAQLDPKNVPKKAKEEDEVEGVVSVLPLPEPQHGYQRARDNSIMSGDCLPRRRSSSHYPEPAQRRHHRMSGGSGVVIRGPFYPYYSSPRNTLRSASHACTLHYLPATALLLLLITAARVY